jgi:hypothetical protein
VATIDLRLSVIGICAALIAGCGGGADTTGGGGGGGGGGNGGGGNNSTTVTVTFGGPAAPVLVAAKIGTGAFAAQTLSGSTLTLSIPSGTKNYAVAYLCPNPLATLPHSSQYEYVWEASIADGTSPSFACEANDVLPSQAGDLTGSVDGTALPGGSIGELQIFSQSGNSVFEDAQGGPLTGITNFNLMQAADGNDRILLLAISEIAPQGLEAAKNFTNQTVPGALNGGNTVVFSAADETTNEAITYNNVPSGFQSPQTYAAFQLTGATGATLIPLNMSATTQYPALPASATESGDVYFFSAGAVGSGDADVFAGATNSGAPVAFTFLAPWSYAGPTAAALPSFTTNYAGFSGQTNVLQEASTQWTTSVGAGSTTDDNLQMEATANYQGGSTTLAVPDLSGVTGFLAPPASSTQVSWDAEIWQQSYSLTGATPLNATWSGVENYGFYTVP